jgi:hypothetical protein
MVSKSVGFAACVNSLEAVKFFKNLQCAFLSPPLGPLGRVDRCRCFSAGAGRVRGDLATPARPYRKLRGPCAGRAEPFGTAGGTAATYVHKN